MKKAYVTGVSLVGLMMVTTVVLWAAHQPEAKAHCQVPCGIYDDAARITHMREDAATIQKAITKITTLAGAHDAKSFNQGTRWVITKEAHASNIIEVVSTYFLTQKVKPVAPGDAGYQEYLRKLADHHAVMVAAMKTKQDAAPATADALMHAIDALAAYYTK